MRRRLATAASALAMLGASALAMRFLVGESSAELENPGRDTEPRVFTSARDQIRMVVPRLWHATDQPTYPGLILWMMRNQPPAQLALTAEAFTRELYCSWPAQCRAGREPLAGRFACALRTKLAAQRLRVGPTQPGPKENDAAGIPSAWFEYEDGRRFLRQAVALTSDRAFSLVMSSPSAEARAAHARAFEQMLRTLRPLTPDEVAVAAAAAAASPATEIDGSIGGPIGASIGSAAPISTDAALAPTDATPAPTDAASPSTPPDAGVTFGSSPATKIDPVGSCP
jgi:hypothetical protein